MQKQDTFRVKASRLTSKHHQVAGGKEKMQVPMGKYYYCNNNLQFLVAYYIKGWLLTPITV